MLELPKLVVPAPFMVRPFAGVYNPFPYKCSILCNHPADFEVKTVVKKAKDVWASEGKSIVDVELSPSKSRENLNGQNLPFAEDRDGMVPEELFRKYTDTDSRPVTPTPTLVSVGTKTSQMFKIRRCMTPDATSFSPAKEKTLLVLDLRRSHSQEAIYWQGNQFTDNNSEGVLLEAESSRTLSPSSPDATNFRRKKTKKKTFSPSTTHLTLQSQTSKESEPKAQLSPASQCLSKESTLQEQDISLKVSEISQETMSEDLNVIKRRGKKKKGKKAETKGDREFQGIPDPGETQVSAIENESNENSSRPFSASEEKCQKNQSEEAYSSNIESKAEMVESSASFLSKEILKQLQRQLDQEVVDTEFNTKRKIALKEALRHKNNPKQIQSGEEMKVLKKEFHISIKDSEKWLSIPRVFTRRSARFELPMDSRFLNGKDTRGRLVAWFNVYARENRHELKISDCITVLNAKLTGMTPLHYIQNYVYASPERLVLYNHVFNLYKEEFDDDEDKERILLGKNMIKALDKIMGKAIPEKEAKNFQNLLDWKDEESLNFRTFTGISAACERLLGPLIYSKIQNQKEDPRDEVERADFESLEVKLRKLNPDRRLVKILKSIRNS